MAFSHWPILICYISSTSCDVIISLSVAPYLAMNDILLNQFYHLLNDLFYIIYHSLNDLL